MSSTIRRWSELHRKNHSDAFDWLESLDSFDFTGDLTRALAATEKQREEAGEGAEAAVLFADPALSSNQYALNGSKPAASINILTAWEDYSGSGVTVGIVDDGFDYAHKDLTANYDRNLDYDARSKDADAAAETGDNHGTVVAGIIGGDANGIGMVGVAHDATLAGYRIGYGSNGSTSQYADALSRQRDVDVSNNSWGYSTVFQDNFKSSSFAGIAKAMQESVDLGRDGLGTVFVMSAGNNRAAGDSVNYHNFTGSQYAMAVAATDAYGKVASFSNPGDALHISAPGSSIYSTDRTGSAGFVSGDYASFNGTSFAAPMVSGAVALMLEANAALGYRDVQEILAMSARQTDAGRATWQFNGAENWNGGGMHHSRDYGFGMLDVTAAVRLAETWTLQSTYDSMDSLSATSAVTTSSTTTTTTTVKVGKGKNATTETKETITTTTSTTSLNLGIPDNNAIGATTKLSLADGLLIDTIEVDLVLTHGRIGDLVATLTSPDGTVSTLLNRAGLSASDADGSNLTSLNFTFTSRVFWGESSGGDWTLNVSDRMGGSTGTLVNWTLKTNGDHATADDLYVYSNEFATVAGSDRAVLSDTDGGIDTINAAAVSTGSVIDLNAGASGQIAGRAFSIAEGSQIENAFGGDGNDMLIGNAADNVLLGGRGADMLTGGLGADTFVFQRLADAGDSITDFELGIDRLDLAGLFDDLAYAGSDPFAHSLLTLGRSGEATDIYVDIGGTAEAVLLVRLLGTQADESQLFGSLALT